MAVSEVEGSRRRARSGVVAALLGVLTVVVLAVVGVTSGSGPASDPLGRARSVVILSVPGLRWQDLAAIDAPALEATIAASAVASVRAIGIDTTVDEGYLTVGAGNRIDAPGATYEVEGGVTAPPTRACLSSTVLASASRSADDALTGAEAGALGRALADAGVVRSVVGPPAAMAALMDDAGCIDRYAQDWPAAAPEGVSLLEVGDLTGISRAADRRAALEAIEGRVADLDLPDDAVVVLIAPAAIDGGAEVTVAAVGPREAGAGVRSLVSATTRRADYVTLPDIAPTVLGLLDVTVPRSMNGTPITAVRDDDPPVGANADRRVDDLADLASRISFRDRSVGPVSVVLVVLGVFCGFAAAARRHRLARMLAPVVLVYPTLTFLLGLTDYHRLPLDAVVAGLFVLSVVGAAVAVSVASRWGPAGAATLLAALLWAVLVVDVATGGHLQINTPLGYTPTIAGRFQGFGNLAFGLVASAGLAVAVVVALAAHERGAAAWAAWVGAITTVVVAAPAFGSDVGGTLAVVPAFVVTVASLAGVRLGWRRVGLSVLGGVVLVVLAAWVDMQRPADSRTHAGRFLDDLLRGDGGLVLRRKVSSNLSILTSSVWSLLFAAVVVALIVLAWARRSWIRGHLADRPVARAYLAGFVTVAGLGFALNDSGIAVPAVMALVGGAWTISLLAPVVRRVPR